MTPKEVRQALSRNPWFVDLAGALADGILAEGKVRHLTDQIVYAAGDPPNGLYALLAGEIRVSETTAAGRSALLLIASPGVWFGETAVIDGKPRSSDALAHGAATVLHLSLAAFGRLTETGVRYAPFAQLVSQRYREAMAHIVTTTTLPLPVRLAQRLQGLARSHGVPRPQGVSIGVHLPQERLADTLGVSRQTLSRALAQMSSAGLIIVGYGTVTIRDPSALDALARSHTLPDGLA